MDYVVHTRDSAPAGSKGAIDNFVKAWGFLPNLGGAMAESPAALEMLWVAYGALASKASLAPLEQQLVCVAASRENGCEYCVSAHSTMAMGVGLPSDVLRSAREGTALNDARLEALRLTTTRLVRNRGWLSAQEKAEFLRAGLTSGQLLEVVAWVAMKTLTNYVNHVAQPSVDAQWQGQLWKKAA